jgi:hypothetical protein
MTTETTKTHYEVGLLLRGEFRRILEKMTWDVPESRYKESKGFLDSTFYVEAPPYTIRQLNLLVERIRAA